MFPDKLVPVGLHRHRRCDSVSFTHRYQRHNPLSLSSRVDVQE